MEKLQGLVTTARYQTPQHQIRECNLTTNNHDTRIRSQKNTTVHHVVSIKRVHLHLQYKFMFLRDLTPHPPNWIYYSIQCDVR